MKKVLSLLFLALIGLFLYGASMRGIPGNPKASQIKNNLDQATKPLELSPERGRFILTMSLVHDKSFALRKELGEAATPDVGIHNGKFYIFFAPGISITAVPFYKLGLLWNLSQVTTFSMVSFFAVLNLLFLFLIAKNIFKLSYWASMFVSLLFGFATTSWSYAITLYQHHITLFLLLSSLYAGWHYQKNQKYLWFYAFYMWVAYGAAIWLDYPNAILLLPVILYFFIKSFTVIQHKNSTKISFNLSFITSMIGFILLIGLHGYYNHVNFGAWNKLSGGITSYKEVVEKQNTNKGKVQKATESQRNVVGFFREDAFPRGFAILSMSRDRGLLFYSPILILGIIGVFLTLKKIDLFTGIILSVIAFNIFLYSSWGDPWGGWAYGPRYLIPTMAILSLFTGQLLFTIKNGILSIITRIVAFILIIYSSAVALLGALTTNAVPPKVEADYLKMNYNFMHNLIFFNEGKSGSFMFNTYFSRFVTLQNYYLIILTSILFIVFILLFVAPLFEKNHETADKR